MSKSKRVIRYMIYFNKQVVVELNGISYNIINSFNLYRDKSRRMPRSSKNTHNTVNHDQVDQTEITRRRSPNASGSPLVRALSPQLIQSEQDKEIYIYPRFKKIQDELQLNEAEFDNLIMEYKQWRIQIALSAAKNHELINLVKGLPENEKQLFLDSLKKELGI